MVVPAFGYAIGPRIFNRYLSDLPEPRGGRRRRSRSQRSFTRRSRSPTCRCICPWRWSASLVGLALVPTLIGFLVFFALINEIGPVRTTVVTYVNPAVALVLGVALLGEPFTLGLGLGFPLVIAGSVLATRRRATGADESAPAARGIGA